MREKETMRIVNTLVPIWQTILMAIIIFVGICGAGIGIFKFVEFISSLF